MMPDLAMLAWVDAGRFHCSDELTVILAFPAAQVDPRLAYDTGTPHEHSFSLERCNPAGEDVSIKQTCRLPSCGGCLCDCSHAWRASRW